MSRDREELIRGLVADLRPIRWPGRVVQWLLAWLPLTLLFSAAAIAATGRYRDGAFDSFAASPGFAFETLVAAVAVTVLARATLVSSVPGPRRPLGLLAWPIVVLGAWIGFYVVDLVFPALPASELGHRDHCLAQTLLIALVNFAAILWIARRLAPLRPRLTGALAGAAAAAVPAALMQFACMYEPAHILSFHFGPVAVMATIGATFGPALLRHP